MRISEHPFVDYHDLAEVLTEQYNGVAQSTEDLHLLHQEFVASQLPMFDSSDLEYMLDDDFARGVIMGIIYFAALEAAEVIEDQDGEDT